MRAFVTFMLAVVVIVLLGYSSCIKDKCSSVVCNNGGVCVDRVCICPTGYEGGLCENEWSRKFLGDWNATENYYRDTNYRSYGFNIARSTNPDSIVIYSLADSFQIFCRQNTMNSFNFVPEQILNNKLTLRSGSGALDATGAKMTGTYSIHVKDTAQQIDTVITTVFSWTR